MEWLEGQLLRVLWASERTGYAVARIAGSEGEVVAVGTLASLADQDEGAFVSLQGDWETHPVHGRQFRVSGLLEATPQTLAGLTLWLASSGVKGIGPVTAGRIVDTFGHDLTRVLSQEPGRLTEIAGIGPGRATAIHTAWRSNEEGRALTVLLRGLGLSQRLADKIRERYGDRAAHVVQSEPFRLADEIAGIGFRTADALARNLGLAEDDPARVRAAVGHALDQAADNDGHCFLTVDELRSRVRSLGVPVLSLAAAIDASEGAGRAVADGPRVWSAELARLEDQVSRDLAALVAVPPLEEDLADEVADAERYEGVQLDVDQARAVAAALEPGVTVITGGPGTGKTTLLRVALRALKERGAEVLLASPTGRAARRLEEATKLPATTVHRMLEYNPGQGGFQRCLSNPLEADAVVVDEVSMVDLPLMSALLDACPVSRAGFRLVLVGDADQLPSVGPGQVLRDLVRSRQVRTVRLQQVHRQAADSGILTAAAAIHGGRVPASGERTGARDVFLLDRERKEDAVDTLVKVVSERLPANGFRVLKDVQVLTPTRRGPLGAIALNQRLQERLNPDGMGLKRGDREFRVGDRVLCTRNRYDVEVFNGDVGQIMGLHAGSLEIDFEGRLLKWERDDLGLLDLAYAMTVHKSQGSEYPAVVLALHTSHSIMLRRNLFYTAATRAQRFLCVVGSARGWARAVQEHGGDERNTGLVERLIVGGRRTD